MTTELGLWRTPEERELQRKREELEGREVVLVQRELDLATLRAELQAFEAQYLATLEGRYALRDRLQAQIAAATRRPSDTGGHERTPRPIAEAEASQPGSAALEPAPQPAFVPSERLKRMYRAVAKRVHPDLATDETARARRGRLMSEANEAYRAGDEGRLKAIVRRWGSSPDEVEGAGPAVELVRTIRTIAQVEERLTAIDAEMSAVTGSDLFHLRASVQEAEADGVDLLAVLAAEADAQIAEARRRLADMADGSALSTPAPPAPGPHRASAPRTVRFPQADSMGTLYVRDRQHPDATAWTLVGEARGTITGPADHEWRLDVAPAAAPEAALAAVRDLDALHTLNLQHTLVRDQDLRHVAELRALRVIVLAATGVTDAGIAHLRGLRGLQTLVLSDTRVSDAGLEHLEDLPALRWLSLARTSVTDAGLRHLWRQSLLQGLNLRGTGITDLGLAYVGGLAGLRVLDLGATSISDAGLLHVSNLTSLTRLVLEETDVSDAGLVHLGRLQALQELNLRGTRVSDTGVAQVCALSGLKALDLAGTGLSEIGRAELHRRLPHCQIETGW